MRLHLIIVQRGADAGARADAPRRRCSAGSAAEIQQTRTALDQTARCDTVEEFKRESPLDNDFSRGRSGQSSIGAAMMVV